MLTAFSFEYSQTSCVKLRQRKTLLNIVFNSAGGLDIEPKELFDFEK